MAVKLQVETLCQAVEGSCRRAAYLHVLHVPTGADRPHRRVVQT